MTFALKRAPILIAALLSVLFSAFVAVPALAQDQPQEVSPESLTLARKYIDLTDRGGVYEATVVEAGIKTYQQLLPQNPEIAQPLNKAIETVITSYRGRKGELFDQMARLYALTFTTEELQAIVAFYESAAGQKLSKANAQINTDMQRILTIFAANLDREFFAKVRAELKAQGIDS